MSAADFALMGAGGRFSYNPKHLPATEVDEASMYLKLTNSTSTNCSAANATSFFNALALRGAQASVSVANTFVTLANLTGAGFAFNFILPTYAGAHTPTLEVTVDGVLYTLTPSATLASTRRMVVGPVTSGNPVTSVGTNPINSEVLLVNGGADPGFVLANVGGLFGSGTNLVGIPTPEKIMAYGMPCLRFESSLLIRMKTDLLAAAAGDRICGATYRMDL
jgi:hypothetical protein